MNHGLSIEVPDPVFKALQQFAGATQLPMESVVVKTIENRLSAITELLPDVERTEFKDLVTLSDDELNVLAGATLDGPKADRLSVLLARNRSARQALPEEDRRRAESSLR